MILGKSMLICKIVRNDWISSFMVGIIIFLKKIVGIKCRLPQNFGVGYDSYTSLFGGVQYTVIVYSWISGLLILVSELLFGGCLVI